MAAIKIGLDAGHGLKTPGKQTPDKIKEWSLNDKVRDKVVKFLAAYDCAIIHTDNDEGNTDEALIDRYRKYMNAGVNVFVSIHHNAYKSVWGSHTGVEVYTDKNPTAKDKELANCIYTRLVKYTGLKGRGVKQCDFVVINQDRIPAVLVEGGFMDSTKDYKYITSEEGQTAYAKAIAEGLIDFLNLKKKTVATSKPAETTSFFPARGYFKKGDRSENVGKIAAFMRRCFPSYTPAAALGNYYGDNIIKAVKEFQKRSGLKPDGYFGPLTLAALETHGFKK